MVSHSRAISDNCGVKNAELYPYWLVPRHADLEEWLKTIKIKRAIIHYCGEKDVVLIYPKKGNEDES